MHEFSQLLSDFLTRLNIVSCYIFINSNCKILKKKLQEDDNGVLGHVQGGHTLH